MTAMTAHSKVRFTHLLVFTFKSNDMFGCIFDTISAVLSDV